jgi:predicted GH43/DUF377 family glycosyl hydrolase
LLQWISPGLKSPCSGQNHCFDWKSPAETPGDATFGVNIVAFICEAYFYEGELYFLYVGADRVVCGGKIKRKNLMRFLNSQSCRSEPATVARTEY